VNGPSVSAGWPERSRPRVYQIASLVWAGETLGCGGVEPRYRCYAALDLCIRNLATELIEGVMAGAHKGRIRG
jgi:hypothetical protein